MNSGTLILSFNDVVVASSLISTYITLVSDDSGSDSNNTYQLTDGSTTSSDGYEIEIILTVQDIEQLRLRSNLATSEDNTFIQFTMILLMISMVLVLYLLTILLYGPQSLFLIELHLH